MYIVNNLYKLTVTSLCVLLYLWLNTVPVEGINLDELTKLYGTSSISNIRYLDPYFGGFLGKMSLCGLNIFPYLICNLILLIGSTLGVFNLNKVRHTYLFRLLIYVISLLIAAVQGFLLSITFYDRCVSTDNDYLIYLPKFQFVGWCTAFLTFGTLLTLLLHIIIDRYGLGMGIPIIILCNISTYQLTRFYLVYHTSGTFTFTTILVENLVLILIFFYIQFSGSLIYTRNAYSKKNIITTTPLFKNVELRMADFVWIPSELLGIIPILFTQFLINFIDFESTSIIAGKIVLSILLFTTSYLLMSMLIVKRFPIFDQRFIFGMPFLYKIENIKDFATFVYIHQVFYSLCNVYFIFFAPDLFNQFFGISFDMSSVNITSLYIFSRLIMVVYGEYSR